MLCKKLKHRNTHKGAIHMINTMSFAISAMSLASKVMTLYHGTKVYADRYSCQGEKLSQYMLIRISIFMWDSISHPYLMDVLSLKIKHLSLVLLNELLKTAV